LWVFLEDPYVVYPENAETYLSCVIMRRDKPTVEASAVVGEVLKKDGPSPLGWPLAKSIWDFILDLC